MNQVTITAFADEFEKISADVRKMFRQSSCAGIMPNRMAQEVKDFSKSIGPGKQVVAAAKPKTKYLGLVGGGSIGAGQYANQVVNG